MRGGQAEGSELVFLPLAIVLPQLTTLAMEDGASEPMTRFPAIELDQNAAGIRFVIDLGE
jgi:hypothetical protein